MTILEDADRYSMTVALANRQTGLIVAQSAARFRESGLDRVADEVLYRQPVAHAAIGRWTAT